MTCFWFLSMHFNESREWSEVELVIVDFHKKTKMNKNGHIRLMSFSNNIQFYDSDGYTNGMNIAYTNREIYTI